MSNRVSPQTEKDVLFIVQNVEPIVSLLYDDHANVDPDALDALAGKLDAILPELKNSTTKLDPQVSTEECEAGLAYLLDRVTAAFDRIEGQYNELKSEGSRDPLTELGFDFDSLAKLTILRDEIENNL
ncbi:hypothetical protein ACQ4M3_41910 [Leptolyngbya sp. AN03gr2]|uniref:hypothetical protein n=1 Tax=unclassified Leptolyngbya TaxID=2650499 RepID=UPI003D322CF4